MKLCCEIELTYRLAQARGGVESKSKRARSILSIGRKGSKGDELHLIVSTVKNVTGSSYKLKENVLQIFGKFLREGKATVRFIEPAHDLCISKADPAKLREFLGLLKLPPREQDTVSVAPLLPAKMKDLDKPPTRLIIKSRGDYPSNGFPSSLEIIIAAGINLQRIDKRLFQLSNLRHLDLSGNTIKSLPEELKNVPLVELYLSGNHISDIPIGLCYGVLANSLKILDVSRNTLSRLPSSFIHFKSLIQLKLDCNQLHVLPRGFGKLQVNLRFFSASSNQLVVLPHSFSHLRLESLDLFGNPFQAIGLVRRCNNLSLPTLNELAAREVKKHRILYDPQSIPVTLCHYLDSAKKCLCGVSCFQAYLHYIAKLDLHKVSSIVTAVDQNGLTSIPIELYLCSAKCLKLWR